MAEALYRKYRPQVFEDVVGQEPIERTLKNAIAQDKVSHAYLFCGPRGTGKTTTARLLAKALLCQSGPTPDPDGTCEDCQLIAEGMHPDVYELDAASRTGVENVREEIISRVQFAPTRGRNKVYIIDEVHMLSTPAFNALLKTLEEPPSHVVFILCTTDPQKVPETIHSRCQRFDFRRIAPESMVSRLGAICIAEGVEFEGEALDLIAHRAEGGLRNALTSLEQIIAFEAGKVTLAGAERLLGSIDSNDMAEIVAYVGKRDIANCFKWTAAYVETGADLAQFVRDMAEHVRNLYVLAFVGDDADLEVNETTRHQMTLELQWFGPDRLARLMGVLGDLSAELKTSSNPRLAFEIALTRMVRPDSDLTLESLAERIEALESGYSSVAHVMPGPSFESDNALQGGYRSDGYAYGAAQAGQQAQAMPSAHLTSQPPASQATPAAAQQVAAAALHQGGQRAFEEAPAAAGEAAGSGRVGEGDVGGYSATAIPSESVPAPYAEPIREAAGTAAQSGGEGTDSGQSAAGSGQLQMLANPATLQRVWQAALSAVKKQKQAYGVLFMNTKVRYDAEAGAVRVVFPAEATFAFNAVQKPEVQEALASALNGSVGAAVPFMLDRAGQEAVKTASSGVGRLGETVRNQPEQQRGPETAGDRAGEMDYSQRFGRQEGESQPFASAGLTAGGSVGPRPSQSPAGAQPNQAEQPPAHQRGSQPAYDDVVPYDDMPYEQVPYEEAPYEMVPYEELDVTPTSGGGAAASEQAGGFSSRPVRESGFDPLRDAEATAVPAFANNAPESASANSTRNAAARPAFEPEYPPAQDAGRASAMGGQDPDAVSAPTAIEPNLTPEGTIAENPADVEALLQAGFGGGVIFSEVEE